MSFPSWIVLGLVRPPCYGPGMTWFERHKTSLNKRLEVMRNCQKSGEGSC